MTKYKENPLSIKTHAIGLQQNKLYLWTHKLRKGKVFLSAELKSILELFFFFSRAVTNSIRSWKGQEINSNEMLHLGISGPAQK